MKEKIKNLIKHPLLFGSLIMVGGNMVVNVINYGYHLVMGRVLGPVDYGILASLYSLLYLIAVVPNSASVAIVKFISAAKDGSEAGSIYSTINRFVLKLAIVLSVLLLFISPLLARFLNINDIKSIAILAFILFFSLITLVNQASSQGLLKFFGSVGPGLVSSLAKLVIGLALVFLGWSVFGAMVGVFIGAVFAYIYSTWYFKKLVKINKASTFNLHHFFKYSLPVILQALAFTSIFTTDLILVKHFLSPFEAGIYAALSTLGKIIFFAVSPVAATMFPIVARRKARGEDYRKVFFTAFGITSLVSIIIVIFYYLFPNVAIGILYGEEYLSASKELVWMGIFIFIYTLSSLLVNFSLSLGKTKVVLFPFIVAVIQIIALFIWHSTILQVIQISLFLTTILFFVITIYLIYNRRKQTL